MPNGSEIIVELASHEGEEVWVLRYDIKINNNFVFVPYDDLKNWKKYFETTESTNQK